MYASPALVRPHFASDFDHPAALWIARLGARNASVAARFNDSIYSDEIRRLVGIAPIDEKIRRHDLLPLLRIRAEEFAQKIPRRKSVLTRNIDLLVDLLSLDRCQADILAFAALSQQHPYLSDTIDHLRASSIDEVTKALGIALNVNEAAIRTAIRPDGELLSTRIVRLFADDAAGAKPAESAIQRRCARSSLGDRYHLRRHGRGLALSCRGQGSI